MKFNEKLIELRKKEGLSQEELGYKLNVTRQTISKWELGQTTPEMDKLMAMSKIFNISVDELVNETEVTTNQKTVIEDKTIGKEGTKNNKKTIAIIIGVLIILIVLIMGNSRTNKFWNSFDKAANGIEQTVDAEKNILEKVFSIFEKVFGIVDKNLDKQANTLTDENVDGVFEKANSIIDKITEEQNNMYNNVDSIYDKSTNIINQEDEKADNMSEKVYSVIDKALEEYNY